MEPLTKIESETSRKPGEESTFSTSTSKPRCSESFSLFGDGSCGEPLMTQHLVMDFTPIDELDNDFVQRKCCAFWELVCSQPELQRLMVLPEQDLYQKNGNSSDSSSESEPVESVEPLYQRTAVSMLDIVEEKGLINRIFSSKLPQSHCSLGSREYQEHDTTLPRTRTTPKKPACVCGGECMACSRRKEASTAVSSPRAVELCRRMQEWDGKHPKSMEPPGHPPALSHCVMQRKIIL